MDQQTIAHLQMTILVLLVNAYLWYRTKKLRIEFQKKWYPGATLVLALFLPFWGLVAMIFAILNGVGEKLKQNSGEMDL